MFAGLQKIPTFATANAEIAQLVEHNLAKVGVASSSLVFRSTKKEVRFRASFFVSLGFNFFPVGEKHFSNWEFLVLLLFQSQSYKHTVVAFGQRADGL